MLYLLNMLFHLERFKLLGVFNELEDVVHYVKS